jgi:hypothetical protein
MLNDAELKTQLIAQVTSLDFKGIIEMVDDYLNSVIASDNDIAYEIRELAVMADEILGRTQVVVDDFNGQVTVYYPNVRGITSSINVVPYIRPGQFRQHHSTAEANLYLRMGFQRSNWLFFDRTSLRLSNGRFDERNHRTFDKTTEVL